MDEIFRIVNGQLSEHNLMVKQGTSVDAKLVESPAHQPAPGETAKHDPEATWTKKRGKFTFGFEAHIGSDQGSELIRKADLTPAHIHDGKRFEAIILGDERIVYADKGY